MPFFASTRQYRQNHTDVFDFITPTAAAMWNLRWQVGGYLAAVPDASKTDIDGRFLAGSGLNSANIRRAAVEHSWERQQEQFGRFALFLFVALYEDWLAQTLQQFPRADDLVKWMQFPSRRATGSRSNGVGDALVHATRNKSRVISRAFANPLRSDGRYRLTNLDNLLVCYRYFKECRNSLLHGGGRASVKLAAESTRMASLSTAVLGTKAVPEHVVLAVGERVTVTLRGVIGFSEVVHRIVTTLDAELALSRQGEEEFLSRWRDAYGFEMLPGNVERRNRRVERQSMNIGFPHPADPGALFVLLRSARLAA